MRYVTPALAQDANLTTRFWSKVDKSGECWTWGIGKNKKGYGLFSVDGASRMAHRVSWALSGQVVPPGMQLDHMCHNRGCVRPDHLRLVTNKQNMENLSGPLARNPTGIRGVSRHGRKWRVDVRHNGQTNYGGYYSTPEEAEQAAIALRNKLFTHNDLDRGVLIPA